MRGITHLACVFSALSAVCAGCSSTNVAVGARSAAVAAYPSSVGNINTPGFALGDLVAVDAKTHKAWKFAAVGFEPSEVAVSQPVADSTEDFDSDFDLTYSKKVAAPVEDQVNEAVRGRTALHVKYYFTRSLKNPAVFAVSNPRLAKAVLKMHTEDPDAAVFLVTAVTSADKVFLTYEGGEDATARVGKYSFHVTYPQNEQLEQLAQDAPAFFKMTALKVEQSDGREAVVVDKTAGDKLPGDAVASLR